MKLVLCDDHPIVVLAQSMMLERSGHDVLATADRPAQLHELVEQHRPDVCLMDLYFGDDPSCLATLQVISKISPHTDVVVVTGSDQASRDAAVSAGATAVVPKSVPSAELLAVIEGRSGGCTEAELPPQDTTPFLLTQRETEVLRRLVEGDSTERMALNLGMRHATARSHVQSVLLKLGVHSRSAAVAMVVDQGLVSIRR